AYWDKFEFPQILPDYFSAEGWMLSTWWYKPQYRNTEYQTAGSSADAASKKN
ncbi:MAG: hypothetical protein GQ546_04665, partial [Gammaproteobacteria bacterium]|nr:hypothetical protein [Gammaproteobacteria bacterium]